MTSGAGGDGVGDGIELGRRHVKIRNDSRALVAVCK